MSDKPKRKQVHYQRNVYKTQKKFPLGANDGTAAGMGGMDRRRKIDEMIDQIHTGKKKKK